jgi:hypothetical protein
VLPERSFFFEEEILGYIKRNPPLFRDLAERNEGYWYPEPDALSKAYQKHKKAIDTLSEE